MARPHFRGTDTKIQFVAKHLDRTNAEIAALAAKAGIKLPRKDVSKRRWMLRKRHGITKPPAVAKSGAPPAAPKHAPAARAARTHHRGRDAPITASGAQARSSAKRAQLRRLMLDLGYDEVSAAFDELEALYTARTPESEL
jgi:hypothetical protein